MQEARGEPEDSFDEDHRALGSLPEGKFGCCFMQGDLSSHSL